MKLFSKGWDYWGYSWYINFGNGKGLVVRIATTDITIGAKTTWSFGDTKYIDFVFCNLEIVFFFNHSWDDLVGEE